MAKRRKGVNKYYMSLTVIVFIMVVAVVVFSSRQSVAVASVQDCPSKRSSDSRVVHGNIELPVCRPNDSLIFNEMGRYTLQYSPSRRSALWVAYKLTLSDILGKVGRSGSFRSDNELRSRGFTVARNEDYKGSGYDKGHLLPSADRQSSAAENRATFILSNCSPQLPALNRGTWKSLEESVRGMCLEYDTLYVVVGLVLDNSKGRIGRSGVVVPDSFFKAILARRGDVFTSMAYVMPNQGKINSDKVVYESSIEEVEFLTGIDLFPVVDSIGCRVSLK